MRFRETTQQSGGASRVERSGGAVTLETAGTLMVQGHITQSVRALHEVIRARPDDERGYLLRAKGFLALGQPEEAARDLTWAQRLGADYDAVEPQLSMVQQSIATQLQGCSVVRRIQDLRVVRFLGAGMEGAVYLCKDQRGRRFVAKMFHPHRVKQINSPVCWCRRPVPAVSEQISDLGAALRRHPHSLFFPYRPLTADGRLEGLYYPYQRLYPLRPRHLHKAGFRSALLREVLSGQAHLIDTMAMVMSDLHLNQFMFDVRGRIRYIDYGAWLSPVSDHRNVEDRRHVLAMVKFLVQVFAPQEQSVFEDPRTFHASAAQLQQRVDQSPGLQRCVSRIPALRPFLSGDAIVDGSRFLEAECYRQAAAAFAGRPAPWTIARAIAGEVRRNLRPGVSG